SHCLFSAIFSRTMDGRRYCSHCYVCNNVLCLLLSTSCCNRSSRRFYFSSFKKETRRKNVEVNWANINNYSLDNCVFVGQARRACIFTCAICLGWFRSKYRNSCYTIFILEEDNKMGSRYRDDSWHVNNYLMV